MPAGLLNPTRHLLALAGKEAGTPVPLPLPPVVLEPVILRSPVLAVDEALQAAPTGGHYLKRRDDRRQPGVAALQYPRISSSRSNRIAHRDLGPGEMNAGIFGTCPVAFLGLWDTVGSVGLYNWNQSFAHTFENESVAIVRHAVSLDERRAAFRSNPWPGQSSLAMISFQWMVREADKAGLHVNDDRMQALLAQCTPKSCATMHESLKRGW